MESACLIQDTILIAESYRQLRILYQILLEMPLNIYHKTYDGFDDLD